MSPMLDPHIDVMNHAADRLANVPGVEPGGSIFIAIAELK